MASLGEVVGALISQVSKGRSQADMATLEVAKIYKENPLLSGFPIPRMTLDEVVIDLKISIASTPVKSKTLNTKSKAEILSELQKMVNELPNSEPSLAKLTKTFPELPRALKSLSKEFMDSLSNLLPEEKEADPQSIAEGAASVIRSHLINAVLVTDPKVVNKISKDFLKSEVKIIKEKLVPLIQANISKILEIQPSDKERFDILITASELQSIPPEKITTMRLTLRESDQSWTHYETEKGEIKEKLVPK